MSSLALSPAWRPHAERNLPRYTSYPTAVAFETAAGEGEARDWLAATRADQAISAYVHVPFCKRLCWYCGCHTSVFHEYDRVRAFFQTLMLEVDLWAEVFLSFERQLVGRAVYVLFDRGMNAGAAIVGKLIFTRRQFALWLGNLLVMLEPAEKAALLKVPEF